MLDNRKGKGRGFLAKQRCTDSSCDIATKAHLAFTRVQDQQRSCRNVLSISKGRGMEFTTSAWHALGIMSKSCLLYHESKSRLAATIHPDW
ncbi:hypothetical protein E4U44_003874 [Claviceps purpurea]|nr:hypothetical protein E4U44_003874 [Claviceps purpurea]